MPNRYAKPYLIKLAGIVGTFLLCMAVCAWIGLPQPWVWSAFLTMFIQATVLRHLL